MARSLGLLQPNETWTEFLHRDTIKQVDRMYQRQPKDMGLILGVMAEEKSLLGGMPAYYFDVPTRHEGLEATVAFDYYDVENNCHENLDSLITKGILTPRVMLPVPTQHFLPLGQGEL